MAKKRLYNLVDRRELKEKLNESNESRTTLSFYRYFNIDKPDDYRDALFAYWERIGVLGRIYIATEGVNGQISLPSDQLETFEATLSQFSLAAGR